MSGKLSSLACLLAIVIFTITVRNADAAGPQAAPQPSQSAQPPPPPAQGSVPKISPRALALLQRACGELADANAFTFHAEVMFDQVLKAGVKLQFAGALDYAVQRPNELAVDYQSDLGAKRFWYDGKTVTIFDLPHKMYASTPAPDSIDEMMDHVMKVHNLSLPLGDMALSNACEQIGNEVKFGTYVGVNDVSGLACDHLAFAATDTDFQIWLQHTGKPLPRKVVINYRTLPGSPEYIAIISNWKFPATIPQSRFHPNLPKEAIRIDFMTVKEKQP